MFSSLSNLASKLIVPSAWRGSDDAPTSNKNEEVPVLQESMADDSTQHEAALDSDSTGEEKEGYPTTWKGCSEDGHVCTSLMGVEQRVQNELESIIGSDSSCKAEMQAPGGGDHQQRQQGPVEQEEEQNFSNDDGDSSTESIIMSDSSCKAKIQAGGGNRQRHQGPVVEEQQKDEEQNSSNDEGDCSTSDNNQCTEMVIKQQQHDLGSVSISELSCTNESEAASSAHSDEEIPANDDDQCAAASMAMAEQQVDSECSSCADEELVASGYGCNGSGTGEEDDEDEGEHKLPVRPSPSSRSSDERDNNLHAHPPHGFGIVPGTVSFHFLEQGESKDHRQQRNVSGGHSLSSRGTNQAAHVSSLDERLQIHHRGGHVVSQGEQRQTGATFNTSRSPQGNLDLLAHVSSAIHGLCPTGQDLPNAPQEEDLADYHNRKGLERIKAGDYTEAIIEHEKALEIVGLETPKSMREAACLFNIGCALMHKGDRDEALRMFRESLKIQCRLAPLSIEAAKSNVKVGFLLAQKGNLFDALFHFREAYALFRDLNSHTMDMANLCIHTGTVLFNQGDFDGSLKSYHEALPIVACLEPESSSEAGLYKKIGAAFNQQGDYECALRNFRRAMAIYEKIEPPTSLQLEKLRFLINFLSADAFNSGKRNTGVPTISQHQLAVEPAAVPFDGPSSEQHTSATQSLNIGRTAESGHLSSSTPETPQLDTRKSRRKRLLPAKFSGDVFVLDQDEQGREEVDISESANENRQRPCGVEASTDRSCGSLLHVSKKQRSSALNSLSDNSFVSASALPSIPRVAYPKWTAEEDKLLLEKRALGLDWSQIAEHLPGRNVNGCKARVTNLGRRKPMIKSTRAPWTEQEHAILMNKHALGWDHLPQRNEGGCRARYNALKASSRGEKAAVSRGDDESVAVKTAGKATPRIKIRPPWTEQEDAILIEKYGLGLDWSQIAEHLPNHNEGGCKRRSDVLGLTSQKKDVVSQGSDEVVLLDTEHAVPPKSPPKLTKEELGLTSQKEDVPGSRNDPRAIRLPRTKQEDSILIEKHKLGSTNRSFGSLLHVSKKQRPAALNSSKANCSASALSIEDVASLLPPEKVSYSEFSAYPNDYIAPIVPGKLDILCGRHREAYNHFGNKLFRSVIDQHCAAYQRAQSRDAKSQITDAIINCIYEGQGRFLKQDDETKLWHNVTRDYAREKVSHALRSGKNPKLKRPRQKKGATSKEYTAEEDATFVSLYTEQQKILQGLINGEIPSEAEQMDFSRVDELPCSSIAVMNESGHPWTTEEDSILRSKRALGRLSWEETAAFLPGRSPDECCSRFESLSRQSKSVVAGPSSSLGAASKRQKNSPYKANSGGC